MKGFFKWVIYIILIIIAMSACSAIFGNDEKSKGDSKKTSDIYSYNKDKATSDKKGAFSVTIKVANGYNAKLKSTNAKLSESNKGNYKLSGIIEKEKANASYKILFTKGKDKETATIKINNQKANTAYQQEKIRTEALQNEKKFSYGMLNKSQDGYKGKPYHITSGHVMQAMEDNEKTLLLVEINNKGYGFYDDLVAVTFDHTTKAIEGDLVEVFGTLDEKFDYDTKIGGSNSVPAMKADSIKVVGKVQQ